ncbi:MAG: aryl-sulfate sulfotransferase [Bacteroidota bacterium]|nr:aryl-sulfate sulfotransferase [Bacteroidota bacterium]MDP4233482.1 aryl-sulfate sulfotransferase [Bacteroidota bacterium]MDP4243360.1 aryl-sulfate sulfotransferase [Bacteroidota bacterium]MDP4287954.1 aryl-sulfate sulfotransferase [Bacteroidota bacterium]
MVRLRTAQALLACTFVLSFFSAGHVVAGSLTSHTRSGIVYQYPLPGAEQMVRETEIGLRARGAFDRSFDGAHFSAVGTRSGIHTLAPRYAMNGRMLLLHPNVPFDYSETVTVSYATRLLGGSLVSDTFSFTTKGYAASHATPYDGELASVKAEQAMHAPARTLDADTVVADTLPIMYITVDNGATPGDIYFANFGIAHLPNDDFLMVADEHGVLKHSREMHNDYAADFKVQPTGLRTYYDFGDGQFYGMDTAWNITDTFRVATGYSGDPHELRVFPDGSYALISDELVDVDMSRNVTGGNSDALVTSNNIQIFDADRNLIFNWRGYDHFSVADAIHERLTSANIDYEHANAFDFDSIGNIVLSNRHLCEITKINGETGAIQWRFGGAHNQFTLVGDSIWFSYQHAVRLLPGGHLTLFDNSNFDTVIGSSTVLNKSRALEYVLDTVNMTATLVWQFHHLPETYSMFMGYVERLRNGNTMIGWGGSNDVAITEVRPDNSTAFELAMWPGNYSYRAIKFPRDTIVAVTPASVAATTNVTGIGMWIEPGVEGANATVHYTLDEPTVCSISVYDVLGRRVESLASNILEAVGVHSASLDLSSLAGGTFFVVLETSHGTTMSQFVRP